MRNILRPVLSFLVILICAGTQTDPAPTKQVGYVNTRYGFSVSLPQSWYGYKIVTSEWGGRILDSSTERYEKGPIISIRHPLWAKTKPRQDIPVMIFTLAQWKLVEANNLIVSAAPIGPSELARNAKYVFALPARYNYALPTGYEEVEHILQNKAVQAF